MKKLNFLKIALLLTAFTFVSNSLSAQSKDKASAIKNPIKVETFSAGRTLSESDLLFLNTVTAKKGTKARGSANSEVTILDNTFRVGQVLTDKNVAAISEAIANSKNAKKVKNKDKSRGDCNLWCYYLLQDSYGNWYYYYYCCG